MSIINTSLIKTFWEGTFDILTTYYPNNIVFYNGSAYIALQAVSGILPETLAPNWALVVQGFNPVKNLAIILSNAASASSSSYIEPARRVLQLPIVNNQSGGNRQTFLMLNNSIKATGAATTFYNGDTTIRYQPNIVAAESVPPKFVAIYDGMSSTYALGVDGSVWCFGLNTSGQLGLGDTANRMILTKISYFTDYDIKIAKIIPCEAYLDGTTGGVTLFLTTTGMVYGTGYNAENILDATGVSKSTPVQIANLSNIVDVQLSAYPSHAAAITNTGNLYMWGKNNTGQLGFGDVNPRSTPTLSSIKDVVSISLSSAQNVGGYTLVLLKSGVVLAAGINSTGQLGVGDVNQRNSFTLIKGFGASEKVRSILAHNGNNGTSLAITTSGNLYMWGRNNIGQLGVGDTNQRNSPVMPTGAFQGNVTSAKIVGVQDSITTYVYSESKNNIYASGNNESGQLSQGSTAASSIFFAMYGINGTILDYQAHGATTNQINLSILYTDGRVGCCGYNANGETGTRVNNTNQLLLSDVMF